MLAQNLESKFNDVEMPAKTQGGENLTTSETQRLSIEYAAKQDTPVLLPHQFIDYFPH